MSKKLPFVTSDIPRDLRSFLDRMRELVSGSGADRLLSANDLANSGLATVDGSGNIRPPSAFVATPPAPTNVAATAAIRNIIVTWDNPAYVGHAHAEVWGSSTSLQADSVLLGMSPGAIYVDEVGPSVTRYYWVRFVNTNDTPGPYNALVGTSATTGSDVAYTLGLLAGQITTTELATTLNNRINLIDGPAATTGTIPNQLALIQGQIDAINAYPEYDNATTYATDDIVKYDGGLYKALSSTTGNLPTNATFWLKIGDYSSLADIVAVHSSDISTLNTGLSGEITARETLATQMRGSYGGTDLASVTSGLIFSERTARADADTGLAGTISTVSATAASKNRIFRQTAEPTSPSVNDVWVDTKPNYAIPYFSEDYSTARHNQYQWTGTEWLDITNTDITDNFALITVEQIARASADEAFAGQITTLETSVNDPVTGLVATRATLINDYSTTSTVTTAIASSKTALRAYTDVSASRTFRQAAAPTKRGVDADTTLDIPLQTGDVWIDTDDLNKMYQWSGTAWVYSPDGAITGSVTALAATIDTEYLTATDTENAIAQSSTFLRAYADIQSKVFRTADEPTKRGVDPETAADIPLEVGDVWYDTNDSNKLYLWSGSAWVYSPDAVITGSVTAVDARVTTVETTQIGYCTIGGVASDNTNKAACEAAGGTWNVGIPIATAVKQVSVSDGADSATLEQRFTAQKTLNDGLKAQYTIKLDVNGNVAGYGVFADSTGSSEFVANVNRFAVTTPQTSIQVRATSTTYAQGAIARVVGQDSKTLVCKIGGTTGTDSITVGNIGTLIVDGSVTWQVASRVPLAVQAVPTQINGQDVPAGVYFDAGYILNATIQNAQIADLAVDDAKIVSLTAAKLTAGSISVGEFIQSTNYVIGTQGWRIHGNGFAEFGATAIRGQLTAAQIDARGLSIQNADGTIILNAGTGNFTGSVGGVSVGDLILDVTDAQAAADAAILAADDALDQLADIASDDILSAVEKPGVLVDYNVIIAEQAGIDAQATAYSITTQKTAYDNAITALTTHLATLTSPVPWDDLTDNTTIVGTTFRAKFEDVYTKRQALLNAITAAAKVLANDALDAATAAQDTADAATNAASDAQDDANEALDQLTDIASDDILSPVEKPRVISDYNVIIAEQAGIDAQATAYSITAAKTAYDTAVAALTTYLATLTSPVLWSNLTDNTDIVGTTFRAKFEDVYAKRQELLNTISAAARTLANSAQGTANSALSTADTANSTANTANSTANTANSTANTALSGLSTKLNSDARNVLAGAGGLATGTLNWNSSGVRTSGFGVGITQAGLVAYNSSGATTFVLNGTTGDATFAGSLSAASGTFTGTLTASAVDAVNTINIAGNAVTVPSTLSALLMTPVNKNGFGTWQSLGGLSVDFGSTAVNATVVLASINLLFDGGSGQTASYIRVRETTTGVVSFDNGVTHTNSVQLTVVNAFTTAFAGVKTFVVEVSQLTTGANYIVGNANITVLGAKR